MIHRNLLRRIERLERRPGVKERRIIVQFDGPGAEELSTQWPAEPAREGDSIIRVLFVDVPDRGDQAPQKRRSGK